MLKGWLAQIGNFLTQEFANAFPNLAGVFGSIVSSLLKPQATALHKAMQFFAATLQEGASWEDAFTATLNLLQTGEFKILGNVEKHLLHAFMYKAKI